MENISPPAITRYGFNFRMLYKNWEPIALDFYKWALLYNWAYSVENIWRHRPDPSQVKVTVMCMEPVTIPPTTKTCRACGHTISSDFFEMGEDRCCLCDVPAGPRPPICNAPNGNRD